MTPKFCEAILSQARNQSYVSNTIIDIVEASSTTSDGTLYLQCLERDKLTLTKWVATFITTNSNVYPNKDLPELPQSHPNDTDSLTMSRQTNTSWSQLRHILDNPSLAPSTAAEPVKPTVPHMIHTQPFTYAVAVNPHCNTPDVRHQLTHQLESHH